MKGIWILDASMLVHLLKERLLEKVCKLKCELLTTDLVEQELIGAEGMDKATKDLLADRFSIVGFNPDEMERLHALYNEQLQTAKATLSDCSAWMYARDHDCLLCSDNYKLQEQAMKIGMNVCGLPLVLDMLAGTGNLSACDAALHLVKVATENERFSKAVTVGGARYKTWLNENFLYGNINRNRMKNPRAICR